MRILVLHNSDQSGYEFRSQLKVLEEILREKHSIELVFADSPLVCAVSHIRTSRSSTHSNENDDSVVQLRGAVSLTDTQPNHESAHHSKRHWFEEKPTKIPCIASEDIIEYVGLDASLFHLKQLWNRDRISRPFRGILAFGQGAALAGIIPLVMLQQPHLFMPGLDFMIFVSGFVLKPPPHESKCGNVPSELHLQQDGIIDSSSIATLHIIGNNNTVVKPEDSMCLVKRFAYPMVYQHSGDHRFPLRPMDLNVIGRFVVQQKQEIRCKLKSHQDMLQLQLQAMEEKAEKWITTALATAPPKALMAIISPRAVGGWLGKKESTKEDGGGAPCPRQFIMKRTEREQNQLEDDDDEVDRSKPL